MLDPANERLLPRSVKTDTGMGVGGAPTLTRPRQREDHQQEPERGDDLGEEVRRRGPVSGRDRDRGEPEHRVRHHGADDASGDLGGDVGEEVTAVTPDRLDPIREQVRSEFGYTPRFTHFAIVGLCTDCAGPDP